MLKGMRKRRLTPRQLATRLKTIKALILDVDGVLTDDHLYIGPDGLELKQFHIGDGLTMVLAMRAGLEIVIMSNRPSAATTTRMKDLQIRHVIQERGDKAGLVKEYFAANGLEFDLRDTAFIGNDIMDIPLAREVGISITVADGYEDLKALANYITEKKGGHGAVREVLELYFRGIGKKPEDYLRR